LALLRPRKLEVNFMPDINQLVDMIATLVRGGKSPLRASSPP